jgi:hypothetical protein
MSKSGTARVFYSMDGREVTLNQLVRAEPDWAVSRINYYMDALGDINPEAAPDLLEALEQIVYEADNRNDGEPQAEIGWDDIDEARAAIAKAKGEA